MIVNQESWFKKIKVKKTVFNLYFVKFKLIPVLFPHPNHRLPNARPSGACLITGPEAEWHNNGASILKPVYKPHIDIDGVLHKIFLNQYDFISVYINNYYNSNVTVVHFFSLRLVDGMAR